MPKTKISDDLTSSLAASPWARTSQPESNKATKQSSSNPKSKVKPTSKTEVQARPAITIATDASTFNKAKFSQYVRALSQPRSRGEQEVAYIRFTPQEKKLLTDFINLDLYPAKLTGEQVSISKLMRYFSWYLLNNHKDEIIQALQAGLKEETQLPT